MVVLEEPMKPRKPIVVVLKGAIVGPCGCGACPVSFNFSRHPLPKALPWPSNEALEAMGRAKREKYTKRYYARIGSRCSFKAIDPAEFGVKIREGDLLRVTFEVLPDPDKKKAAR